MPIFIHSDDKPGLPPFSSLVASVQAEEAARLADARERLAAEHAAKMAAAPRSRRLAIVRAASYSIMCPDCDYEIAEPASGSLVWEEVPEEVTCPDCLTRFGTSKKTLRD